MLGVIVRRRPRVRGDRVLVIGRPHRQGVADDHPAGRRLPRRHEDIRAGLVVPGGRMVDVVRREPERPRLAVEQAPEDARRVEAWNAEPVDRAVGRDERTRVAVGQERVVRDRGERGRRGGALRRLRSALVSLMCTIHGPCQRPCPATRSCAFLRPPGAGCIGVRPVPGCRAEAASPAMSARRRPVA